MSDTPWIKFYASDWLAGTSGLSAAERGVYITILALIYEADGSIPHDEGRLSRRCGVTKPAFSKLLAALLTEGKLTLEEGRLSNRRAETELAERKSRSEKASLSAQERWRTQGKKTKQDQGPGNANASAKQCSEDANQNQNQKSSVETNVSTGAEAPLDPVAVLFRQGLALLMAGGVKEGSARALLGKWKREHGPEAVIVALGKAQREGAIDPVSFIEKCLRHASHVAKGAPRLAIIGGKRGEMTDMGWISYE